MRDGSLLVVDDESALRDLLVAEFGRRGYSVDSAADGSAAVERVRTGTYEVVLTDVRMPGVTGLDVLQATRAREPDTEVIILTAYASFDTAIECLRAGAFDLVTKPFNLDALASTVARAFERRQLRATRHLYEASRRIFSADGAERLPELVVDLATRTAAADDASLMLADERGGLYLAFTNAALSDEVRRGAELKLGERIAGRVAVGSVPILLQHTAAEDPRFKGVVPFRGIRSSMVFPLVATGGLVGVLSVNRTVCDKPFRESDMERVGIIANQAAAALQNASLIQRLVWNERLAAIGQLSAAVAHEINNPIAYVSANLDHVRAGVTEFQTFVRASASSASTPVPRARTDVLGERWMSDIEDALKDAIGGVRRVKEVVRDMLAFARPSIQRAPFRLLDSIRSASRMLGGALGDVALTVSVDPELVIEGSSSQISQVFMNLLANALHAVRELPPGRPREIHIRSRMERGFVTVEVSDSGIGLERDEIPRLFQAFYSTKSAEDGTGLGLSICREIVTRHGGEISAEERPAGGATFLVRLPVHDQPAM